MDVTKDGQAAIEAIERRRAQNRIAQRRRRQRFAALHRTQENNKSSDQSAAVVETKPAGTPNNNNFNNNTCPTCKAISIDKHASAVNAIKVVNTTSSQTETTVSDNSPQPPTTFDDDWCLADINAFLNLDDEPIDTIDTLAGQTSTSETAHSPSELKSTMKYFASERPASMNEACASLIQQHPRLDVDLHLSLPTAAKAQHRHSHSAATLMTDTHNMDMNYAAGGRRGGFGDSNRGKNVLHISAERGNVRLVELMLDHGVDVDRTDGYGRTALHYAAGGAHVEIVARLLAAGADPEVHNYEGMSPLHVAAHVECEPIIELLRRVGADLNAGIGVASSEIEEGRDGTWPEWSTG